MAAPDDNSGVLKAADDIREYEFARGHDSRDEEVADLTSDVDLWKGLAATKDLTIQTLEAARVALQAAFDAYKASHPDTDPPPPPPPPPDPEPTKTIIGMSSPDNLWTTRLSEVGADGITARRIFVPSLDSAGNAQMDLVQQAHDAGMMPVFSFKTDVAAAKAGQRDSYVQKMVANLARSGKPTTVTYAHEPRGDMSPADFVALNRRFAPIIQAHDNLKFGPFVNGWLLDRLEAEFTSYTRDSAGSLLDVWDFMGIDTYEEGTIENPGAIKPADRIPKLVAWCAKQGHPDIPIGIGEWNGYSAKSLRDCGEAIMSTPQVWFGCLWNATTGKGYVLEGERLAAFKAVKSDVRVVH